MIGNAPTTTLPSGVNNQPSPNANTPGSPAPARNVAELPHYMQQRIQPIRFMQASMSSDEFKGFLKGNIIKYTMREGRKNGLEDIKKAQVYVNWLVEFCETGNITVPGEHVAGEQR